MLSQAALPFDLSMHESLDCGCCVRSAKTRAGRQRARKRAAVACLIGAALGICIEALAVAADPKTNDRDANKWCGTFSFVLENDLFGNLDKHYTNGVRASCLSTPRNVPDLVRGGAALFPGMGRDSILAVEYALGQSIYTPGDITRPVPDPTDRPYAGWLYFSLGVTAATYAPGERNMDQVNQLDQLSVSLGLVGPAAKAGETQDLVHRIIDADRPQGWDHQLKNEPGVVLEYHHTWQFALSQKLNHARFDVAPYVGGALGNVFTYLDGGATVRFGPNLPDDYGPPRISPSLPGSGYFEQKNGFGWYFFAGAGARVVVHNIFLDGNTFRDGPSVDKLPLVGDAQAGLVFAWPSVSVAYTHVFRTREFVGQDHGDQFGAVSVSIRF